MATINEAQINEIFLAAQEKHADLIDDEMLTIGVRMICDYYDEFSAQVGDTIEINSRVWVDGEYTDEELNGLSAIGKKFLNPKSWNGYSADKILILASDCYRVGTDNGEIIMRSPKVLEVIEVK